MQTPKNKLKAALKRGEMQYGCWASFGDNYATEILATANFDWLVIDAEHSPNDLRSILHQLQILENRYSEAVVRLPIGSDWMIKQVLDAGAQSLLIPMVETAEQAKELVRATRYPPYGIRGSGAAIARASMFAAREDYVATIDDEICLIVQVETRNALSNLDEILKVDGVDAVFVGPSDLSMDMGKRGNSADPEVRAAIKDALQRIAASDKAAGIVTIDDREAQDYASWGAQFLGVGIDVLMLAKQARETMNTWRLRDDRK